MCKKLLVIGLFVFVFVLRNIQAEEKQNFDLNWKFIQKDLPNAESVKVDESKWRTLDLPHDWSIEGDYRKTENGTDWQSGYLPAGIGWYRKTFDLKPEWKNKKIQILFDGAYMNSDVWINGHLLGHRPNGYISFYYDLTPFLKNKDNIITVKIDQSKPLSGRWYTGSGLYRSVWLLITGKTHIEPWGVCFTSPSVSKEKAEIDVVIDYQNVTNQALTVVATLMDNKGKVVASIEKQSHKDSTRIELSTSVHNPKLWQPESPMVYKLVCSLKKDGVVLDQTSRLVGIRKLTFTTGTGFSLNDIPTKIKGVCDHHTAGAVGAAVPDDVLYRRLKLLKDMGVNTIRTAHNPYSPQFYTMCDTMGIMVMNEAFDGWEKPKAKDDYGNYFTEWWKKDLTDFIKRDRNHPSVIIWSIGNEVSGATPETQKKLVGLIHSLDSGRPVTQGGTDPTRGMSVDYEKNFKYLDIIGFNGNGEEVGEFEKFNTMNLNRCAIGTEVPHTYQTRGVYRTRTAWRRRDFPAPWELKTKIPWDTFKSRVFEIPDLSESEVFPEEAENKYYQSSYDNASVRISARHSWQRTNSFPFLAGEIRWGSFDYLGEAEWPQRCGNFGVLDLCGFPKDEYYLYQSLWSDKPMVHLLPHWTHPGKEGIKIPVVVYTNCQSAELFLNGESLGKQTYRGEQLVWQVPYKPGKLKVLAYNDDDKKVCEKISCTAEEPKGIKLTTDKIKIRANQKDIIHVEIDVVDEKGNFCPKASNMIGVEVTGAAKILAMDNGDPIELTPYQVNEKKAFRGKCLLILQATSQKGLISLQVQSKGLISQSVRFLSE